LFSVRLLCTGTVSLLNWNCLLNSVLNFGTILLREYLADWIENTSYLDTTAASIFVTAETTFKICIPVITVCYLHVAA
jgi:hypothetical protein